MDKPRQGVQSPCRSTYTPYRSNAVKKKIKILFDKGKNDLTFHIVFVIMYAFQMKRGVAQLVARSVRDAEVVGSIPVASTKNTVQPCGCTVFFVFCDGCEKPRITVGSREKRPQ